MKSRVSYAKVSYAMRFIQGELYISTDTNTIVICNISTNSNVFTGTCLVKGDCNTQADAWIVGEQCNTCYGSKFIPFKGTIELTGN